MHRRQISWSMLFVVCCGSTAAGTEVQPPQPPFPLPYVFSLPIDQIGYGDDPQFVHFTGPGGMEEWLGVPSNLQFHGFAENLRNLGILLNLRAGIDHPRPYGFQSELHSFGDLHLPGLNDSGLPVQVPIDLSLVFPDSFPTAFIHFEARDYTNEGLRLHGELRYVIGVPEPSTVVAAVTCLILAWGSSRLRLTRGGVRERGKYRGQKTPPIALSQAR